MCVTVFVCVCVCVCVCISVSVRLCKQLYISGRSMFRQLNTLEILLLRLLTGIELNAGTEFIITIKMTKVN